MITTFHGQYRFLSNFWPCTFTYDGKTWPSVEHAYQASKFTNPILAEEIRCVHSPAMAKALARMYTPSDFIRKDFHEVKRDIMFALVRLKFQDPHLAQRLLDTGDQQLIEGNHWNDTYWGVCRGHGHNHLGRILEAVRAQLRIYPPTHTE